MWPPSKFLLWDWDSPKNGDDSEAASIKPFVYLLELLRSGMPVLKDLIVWDMECCTPRPSDDQDPLMLVPSPVELHVKGRTEEVRTYLRDVLARGVDLMAEDEFMLKRKVSSSQAVGEVLPDDDEPGSETDDNDGDRRRLTWARNTVSRK